MSSKLLQTVASIAILVCITEKGVYDAEGEIVPIDTELEIDTKDGKVPAALLNKCRLISVDGKKPVKKNVPITNPNKGGKGKKPEDEYDDADLTQINGIGASTAKSLGEAGLDAVSKLAEATDEVLEALPANLLAKAIDLRDKAKELVAAQSPAS